MRTLVIAAVFSAGLLLGPPASAGSTTVLVADSSTNFAVRPSLIGYTGDATGYFGRRTWGGQRGFARWTTWTARRAEAVGTVWVKSCTPTCADGTWSKRKGSVSLSAPRKGRFTRMTVRYTASDGRIIDDRRKLGRIPAGTYSDGYWIWRIAGG